MSGASAGPRASTTQILRRGLDLTIANWPVIAVRIVEGLVLFAMVIGALAAAIVPIIVSLGLTHLSDVTSVAGVLVNHWVVIVYALLVILVLLVFLVAVHAFVDGGVAQVLVDSERSGAKPAFRMDRVLAGGRRTWWAIFWIYNLVWSVAGLVVLVPLCATLAGMIAVNDDTGRIVIACGGLLLSLLVLMPVGILAAVWTQKAIAVCVARNANASASMQIAKQEMSGDLGRHFAVAFIMLVISIGGSALIGFASFPMSLIHQNEPLLMAFTAPGQIVVSFAQTIFSSAAGAWFLASFIAISEERR